MWDGGEEQKAARLNKNRTHSLSLSLSLYLGFADQTFTVSTSNFYGHMTAQRVPQYCNLFSELVHYPCAAVR